MVVIYFGVMIGFRAPLVNTLVMLGFAILAGFVFAMLKLAVVAFYVFRRGEIPQRGHSVLCAGLCGLFVDS